MPIFVEVPKAPISLVAAIQRQLRLVFFGTPQFAVPALQRLHADGWPIAAVVTGPDKPMGRKHTLTLTQSPVKMVSIELGLSVYTPTTLKDDVFFATFENLKPNLCVIAAYGKLIPKRYLDVPRLGFINIHPSLLPLYRGPSPIQSAILNGDTETGVTIMQVDSEMDHGSIISVDRCLFKVDDYLPDIEQQLAKLGAELLIRTLPDYIEGTIVPQPQDHTKATFTKKFTREDGRIDWIQPTAAIHNRIRAFAKEPGTWTIWRGTPLNILKASCTSTEGVVPSPGTVVRHHDGVAVATSDGFLTLETIQLAGSRVMPATDFANGHKDFLGSILE